MKATEFVDNSILSINPGHDGAVSLIEHGVLKFSRESEHGSKQRHLPSGSYALLRVIQELERVPAIICTSGWPDEFPFQSGSAPYYGIDENLATFALTKVFGHECLLFASTHERAHIFCSYGLSQFSQGQPCYALVWEGYIGSFYEIDEKLKIKQHGPVLRFPGYKYAFLYDLADKSREFAPCNLDNAGKLMALAAHSKKHGVTSREREVIGRILEQVAPPITDKKPFRDTDYFNMGFTSPLFCDLVASFSDALFQCFYEYAKRNLQKGYPLLISGGCGLNCEWNARWRDCGLFSEVFVPPIANDSGVAIGTAIEAQFLRFGNAKISWNVYSGSDFDFDEVPPNGYVEHMLDLDELAKYLAEGAVVAWVQGTCEIGPRALGNRSILAAPFNSETTQRLNGIKEREEYRPIAPVCLEEDASALFGIRESPYMLYFTPVHDPMLKAVTHVDGSARPQTVSREQNKGLHDLLVAFKRRTGYGVLCNTSLNQRGRGFINRASDLFSFAVRTDIDVIVVDKKLYVPVGQNRVQIDG